MSHINIKVSSDKQNYNTFEEKIRLAHNGLTGNLKCYTGEQGEFWVSIIPSLNVSGYGQTEEDSIEDLKVNVTTLCDDLFQIDDVQRKIELSKLGWAVNKFFRKRFSKAYVDENGLLQNFDHPEKVKKSILEAA